MPDRTPVEAARRRIGRVGAGLAGRIPPSAKSWRRELPRLEGLGYGAMWSNEGVGGKEAFAQLAVLLAASDHLAVGSGIANIWARHPAAMQAGAATLADAYPGRFVLGVGVSHPAMAGASAEGFRPVPAMRDYLDRMDASSELTLQPGTLFPRVLAALGPRMLELAAERADGAFPAFTPVEHTRLARDTLGPDRLLVVGLRAVLDPDRASARRAVPVTSLRRGSPYRANLERLGYPEAELDSPTDELVDAIAAAGDERLIADRVAAHLDAGADHVVLMLLAEDLPALADQLERLAPALLG